MPAETPTAARSDRRLRRPHPDDLRHPERLGRRDRRSPTSIDAALAAAAAPRGLSATATRSSRARTSAATQRVVIAGHIDTVPINDNVPTRDRRRSTASRYLWGRGTVDMKAGVAVQLKLAAELTDPRVDITWMWYDHEEVDADLNGLTRLARTRPDLFAGDFAILGEPSNGAGRGRLQRQPARDRAHARRARAQRARAGSARTRSTRPRPCSPGSPSTARASRGRRARLPRGPQRGADRRRGRGQRHPRPDARSR